MFLIATRAVVALFSGLSDSWLCTRMSNTFNKATYCLERPVSYLRIQHAITFAPDVERASLFLDGSAGVIELSVAADVSAEAAQSFSLFAIGTTLHLENISVVFDMGPGISVAGLIPFSAATFVRNGRVEFDTNGPETVGVARKLIGDVKLDSLVVRVQGPAGASVSMRAFNARLFIIHCLFVETLSSDGGLIISPTNTSVETWVDSSLIASNTAILMTDLVLAINTPHKCEAVKVPPSTIPMATERVACPSSGCLNIDATFNGLQLNSTTRSPFSEVSIYSYITVRGTLAPTGAGTSLLSYESAKSITCVFITVTTSQQTTARFAQVVYKNQYALKVESLFIKAAKLVTSSAFGFAAFQFVQRNADVHRVSIEGTYSGGTNASLFICETQGAFVAVTIEHLVMDAFTYTHQTYSSFLINSNKAKTIIDDVQINYEQSGTNQLVRFGGIFVYQENSDTMIRNVNIAIKFNFFNTTGLLGMNLSTLTTLQNVTLHGYQKAQYESDVAPIYLAHVLLSNYTADIQYHTTGYSASVAYEALGMDVANITLKGNADATRQNQMIMFMSVLLKPTKLTNATATDFKSKTGGTAAVLSADTHTDFTVQNVVIKNAVINYTNHFTGVCVGNSVNNDQTLKFVNVSIEGLIRHGTGSPNKGGLLFGGTWLTKASVIDLQFISCTFEIKVTGGTLDTMFGYYNKSGSTVILNDTKIMTNQTPITCVRSVSGIQKPQIKPQGSEYVCT